MVIVAALGAGFRIAPRPHARVHGVDGRLSYDVGSGERMAGQKLA